VSSTIPDDSYVYRRIPRAYYCTPNGIISASAFELNKKRNEQALSVDWADLCSPEETRERDGRDPTRFAVVKLRVGKVRNLAEHLPKLEVEHDPIENNPAHTLIWGENGIAVRTELRDACKVVLEVDLTLPPKTGPVEM
jgi:hypothetical protein